MLQVEASLPWLRAPERDHKTVSEAIWNPSRDRSSKELLPFPHRHPKHINFICPRKRDSGTLICPLQGNAGESREIQCFLLRNVG